MTDWRRMEWQIRANRVASWVRTALVLLTASEIGYAISHHFPWWDDALAVATLALVPVAHFVEKNTRMYRWDLE